jgi:integrase
MKLETKLTDALARSLTTDKEDDFFWDSEQAGFALRIRAGGARSWHFQYDRAGQTRKMSFGPITGLSAGKARAMARDLAAQIRLGGDPAAERRQSRADAKLTFGALLPRFLIFKRPAVKPRTYAELDRYLNKNLKPLHSHPVAAIDRRMVAGVISRIASDSGNRSANLARAWGSNFYGWLVTEGIAETNPFDGGTKYAEGGARTRTPSLEECVDIWNACAELGQYGDIVRLLLLVGARINEIGSLRWSEIDFDQAQLILPPARTKSRRRRDNRHFLILLSDPAVAILKAQPRRVTAGGNARQYVFGLRSDDSPFGGWSPGKQDLDAAIAKIRKARGAEPMEHWVVHDLRRAIVSHMNDRLGIEPHIADLCLGHNAFRRGVAGVYNRAEYVPQRRAALARWADLLLGAVSDETDEMVVPLRK